MNRVFSNGPLKDFVINPFQNMVRKSTRLWIAAPYVTMTQDLVEASASGKSVYLLVGLNASTTPEALSKVHGLPNCEVRYFTRRFHAKIYLFDSEALVGSSNLTEGGLKFNREATICVKFTRLGDSKG
jgi:HKD family nuclease